MKFLHTADWQIGMKAAHVGAVGVRVREERLAAGKRVVEAARINGAAFIIITGDTFEDNGVDRLLIQKVADILAAFPGQVYVTAGNHDPWIPGSIWEHPVWKSVVNVHLLLEEKPVEVPGGFLYPCSAREKRSGKDPTAWIDAHQAHGIRIGLAHGTVEGVYQEEPDYPIPRDAPLRTGLDYLALGHWHSTSVYPAPNGAVRMAYSGTHEMTRFGERDSGNALIVEIPDAGAPPVITPVRTGSLIWKVIDADLRETGDLSRLREQIVSMEHPDLTLLRCRFTGLLPAQDQNELIRINEILASGFLFGQVETAHLRPAPLDESWLVNLPVGILREAATRLKKWTDPAYTGERPEGASAEAASRALRELYSLSQGGTPNNIGGGSP